MNLVIRAHTLKTETLSQPITGQFDERGGTIGRSDTNTLTLPDPERHISRLQAEVWFSNGAFAIRNVGSANSITLNGRPVNPGEGATLAHGDELMIGAYAMRATVNNAPGDQALADDLPSDARTVIKASSVESRTNPRITMPPPVAVIAPPRPAPSSAPAANALAGNPFADLLGGSADAGAQDPFADLMGTPVASNRSAGNVVQAPVAAPAPSTPVPSRLPDDFDPFADLPSGLGSGASSSPNQARPADAALASFMSGSSAAPAASLSQPSSGATSARGGALPADLGLGELLGTPASQTGSSLDAMFGLGAPSAHGKDPLADFLAAPAPGSNTAAPSSPTSQDPLAMFNTSPVAAPPAIPADFDHTPDMQGAYRPPKVQAAPPEVPPRQHARVAALAASSASLSSPSFSPLPGEVLEDSTSPMPLDATLPSIRSPLPTPHPAPAMVPAPPAVTAMRPPASGAIVRARELIPAATMPAVHSLRHQVEHLPDDVESQADALAAAPRSVPATASSVAPVQSAAVAPAAAHAPDALWAAFCEGAGISLKLPQGLTPELMRVIGQVLHHSIDGTVKLVAVRAAAKQELRADVTTIQARNNNPLKFSPDAGVAIEQLLQPPMRGFMMGPAAVNDAMDDLLGHAIGTMAGMRAALTGVLERFEPKQLEGKLASNSVLDAVLPMNRRAKLWELYLQHYQRIRDDAQDDFHDLFGRAFIEAYEEQLDRLDADRHPS